ncbi:MAG: hypothetical protein HY756_06840, partial [Nitrospirae bacterium]|nr:hypothetical protein [Nitrospirota bacterium]
MTTNSSKQRVIVIILKAFCVLSAILTGAMAWAQSCPGDMTNYWKLNETSGLAFSDSLSGNSAACAGSSCPSFVTGRVNNALTFDGLNDAISAPAAASFNWNISDSFSIEFWMKTQASSTCSGGQAIVGRDDGNIQWRVGCQDGGRAVFCLYDKNRSGACVAGSTTDLTDGLWHHVVAVRDAVSGKNRIYVDGIKEGEISRTYSAGFDSATAALTIGWLNAGDGFNFAGTIDEVALYKRGLSDAEISSHFYIVRGYCDMCSSPVRVMPVGDSITEGLNSTLTDRSFYMVSYRQKLYLDLSGAGYNVNFVGSLQSGSLATPSFDIDHEGHSGYSAAGYSLFGEVLPNIYNWLTVNPADVVLLHIGTNDVGLNEQSADEIAAILNEIDRYSTDTTVLLARIIDQKYHYQAVTDFNNSVAAMANARINNGDKIIIVDQEHALTYPDDMDDLFHPTQTGYNKMADAWLSAMTQFLPQCNVVIPTQNIAPLAIVSASSENPATGQLAAKAVDTVGPLTNNGSGNTYTFAARTVTWVRLVVNQAAGYNAGLSEFEVYGAASQSQNHPPVANAGQDQTVNEGAVVTLNGAASSDADGDPLTYNWTQLQGRTVTLSNAASSTPSFTAPAGLASSESLVFQLIVSDGQSYSLSDTVTITVNPLISSQNIAPLAIVSASSENPATGQLAAKAVDTVKDGYPGDYTKEWATQGQ